MLLTATGEDLWWELNGDPRAADPPAARPQGARAGREPRRRVDRPDVLYAWLVRNLERLIEELQFHEVRPSTLNIAIAYHDAGGVFERVPLPVPSDQFHILLEAARHGSTHCYRPRQIATHMHVIASGLRSGPQQLSLFEPPDAKLDAYCEGEAGDQRVLRPLEGPVGLHSLGEQVVQTTRLTSTRCATSAGSSASSAIARNTEVMQGTEARPP